MMGATIEYLQKSPACVAQFDISSRVLFLLMELGFRTDLEGFQYLKECLVLKTKEPHLQLSAIYFRLIESFGNSRTYEQLDQAIRNVIRKSWYKVNRAAWEAFFPAERFSETAAASNAAFICYIANIVAFMPFVLNVNACVE